MITTPDLFGAVLLEHLAGSRQPSHLRRGDGRIAVLEVARYFQPYAAFAPFEQALLQEARGDVLDLGGGAGRAALYLAEQTIRGTAITSVTAVDRSPGACLCMRRRGVAAVTAAGWEELGHAVDARSRFDTIVLLGAGLGMAGSPEGLERLLTCFGEWLRPAGLALVTAQPPTGARHDAAVTTRLRVESRGRIGEWFGWLLVPPPALRAAAERCGLTVLREPPHDAGGEYGVILGREAGAGGPASRR